MKRNILSLALATAAVAAPTASFADLAFNVGAVTDYRFRGISQTRLKPALQGGVDFSQGPFYLGLWASSIKWIKDAGGDAGVEVDLYGGYKFELAKDMTLDVGILTYQYPGNDLNPSANTTEIYGAYTFGPATIKYSHSVDDTFGVPRSKNSYYLEAAATFDLGGGFNLTPHIGYQKFKGPNDDAATYTDYSLAVSKDFSGFLVSLAAVATDADKTFYASPRNGKFLGKSTVVLGVKYAF